MSVIQLPSNLQNSEAELTSPDPEQGHVDPSTILWTSLGEDAEKELEEMEKDGSPEYA